MPLPRSAVIVALLFVAQIGSLGSVTAKTDYEDVLTLLWGLLQKINSHGQVRTPAKEHRHGGVGPCKSSDHKALQ